MIPPYGWKFAIDGIHLELNIKEQTVLKLVYVILKEGLIYKDIEKILVERGVLHERKDKTKRDDIVKYWKDKIYEGDMGCDWCDALNRCWRCGEYHNNLDRCHIVPSQLEGKI
jgi:hypothetical protein